MRETPRIYRAPPDGGNIATSEATPAPGVAAGPAAIVGPMGIAELQRYHEEHVVGCIRCPLSESRTQVVVGSGRLDADVMFVGEAPGYHEDQQGIPFVGQAGKLLSQLLEGIGLAREDVYIANVLKCRPPDNRNPAPAEISACEPHLFRQVAEIRPALVCTLGNFATKLLSGRPEGISRVHGCELPLTVAGTPLLLYPLFHPAAALYARATLGVLEEDFARIPSLIERVTAERAAAPAGQPGPEPAPGRNADVATPAAEDGPARAASPATGGHPAPVGEPAGPEHQLGLF